MFKKLVMVTILLTSSSFALAEENKNVKTPHLGIGGGYSNIGEGLEFTLRLTERFGMNYSFYQQNEGFNVGGYQDSVDVLNRSISLDYFPMKNDFYITGGIVIPDNETSFSMNAGNSNLNSIDSNLLSIDGKVKMGGGLIPYLGVGFKRNNKEGLGYFTEAGVSYLDPEVSLSSDYQNSSYSNSVTEKTISAMEQELYNEIDDNSINYMIKAGFYYIF